jgi:hypothetical protein
MPVDERVAPVPVRVGIASCGAGGRADILIEGEGKELRFAVECGRSYRRASKGVWERERGICVSKIKNRDREYFLKRIVEQDVTRRGRQSGVTMEQEAVTER